MIVVGVMMWMGVVSSFSLVLIINMDRTSLRRWQDNIILTESRACQLSWVDVRFMALNSWSLQDYRLMANMVVVMIVMSMVVMIVIRFIMAIMLTRVSCFIVVWLLVDFWRRLYWGNMSQRLWCWLMIVRCVFGLYQMTLLVVKP